MPVPTVEQLDSAIPPNFREQALKKIWPKLNSVAAQTAAVAPDLVKGEMETAAIAELDLVAALLTRNPETIQRQTELYQHFLSGVFARHADKGPDFIRGRVDEFVGKITNAIATHGSARGT